MIDANKINEDKLLKEVQEARKSGASVNAILKTDERVFARITDGIYREPASALRELIANAYDADAFDVRVETDAPRFSQIVVRDDGHGLTEAALVHVICHIGGSLKRTEKGADFNVVSEADKNSSPGGRKLIGKLGIGLFSVSQLTHHLTIVTKVKGEDVRRVCDIFLVPQREDAIEQSQDDEERFITGNARIKTVPASDLLSQGTEITLHEIRPFVRESLQSAAMWASIEREPLLKNEDFVTANESNNLSLNDEDELIEDDEDFVTRPPIPHFHIGRVSHNDPELLVQPAKLPWNVNDSAKTKFEKLVSGIQQLDTGIITKERIKLNDVLDTYFRTIWTLSLSVPLPYIKKHPFSLKSDDGIRTFALSNKPIRPKVDELSLPDGKTIRQQCQFITPDHPSSTDFSVHFDGLLLKRPLPFPRSYLTHEIGESLLFVGKIKSDMNSLPKEYSGGTIEVEAYYFLQNRIVPAEHNGVMVRINGASGIMFDDQFLRYQVSEQNRLKQITAEIFINRGLDAALNIDRESFNIAHPHYQFLKKWVHHSLRQIITKHKSLSKGNKDLQLTGVLDQAIATLNKITHDVQTISKKTELSSVTKVIQSRQLGDENFDLNVVLSPRNLIKPTTTTNKLKERLMEEQIKSVAKVLEGYQFYQTLDFSSKNELLRKIVAIFTVDIK